MSESVDRKNPEEFSEAFMSAVVEFYEEWKEEHSARLPDFEAALVRAANEGVMPIRRRK